MVPAPFPAINCRCVPSRYLPTYRQEQEALVVVVVLASARDMYDAVDPFPIANALCRFPPTNIKARPLFAHQLIVPFSSSTIHIQLFGLSRLFSTLEYKQATSYNATSIAPQDTRTHNNYQSPCLLPDRKLLSLPSPLSVPRSRPGP